MGLFFRRRATGPGDDDAATTAKQVARSRGVSYEEAITILARKAADKSIAAWAAEKNPQIVEWQKRIEDMFGGRMNDLYNTVTATAERLDALIGQGPPAGEKMAELAARVSALEATARIPAKTPEVPPELESRIKAEEARTAALREDLAKLREVAEALRVRGTPRAPAKNAPAPAVAEEPDEGEGEVEEEAQEPRERAAPSFVPRGISRRPAPRTPRGDGTAPGPQREVIRELLDEAADYCAAEKVPLAVDLPLLMRALLDRDGEVWRADLLAELKSHGLGLGPLDVDATAKGLGLLRSADDSGRTFFLENLGSRRS